MKKSLLPIEQADKEVQLAVDLIYLLETNQIEPDVALKALKIVEQDLVSKQTKKQTVMNKLAI